MNEKHPGPPSAVDTTPDWGVADPPVVPVSLGVRALISATRSGNVYWTPTEFVLTGGLVHDGFRATFGPWEVALDTTALVLLVRPIDEAQRPPSKLAEGPMLEYLLAAVRAARTMPIPDLFMSYCRTAR
jgi:hypothetical protein